jgi:hypothetical protein
MSNAHKYSPADQEVRLRVWRDNGWPWRPWPTRGRGIPREELNRAMGGEIEAISAPRRGSTFTVRLPLAPRPDGAEETGPAGRERADDGPSPGGPGPPRPRPFCRCRSPRRWCTILA